MEKLSQYAISSVYPLGDIVYLHENQKVAEAVKILSENNIYSAPVLSANNEVKYVIDFSDLVGFAVKSNDELNAWGHDHFYSFLEHSERLAVTPILEILQQSKKHVDFLRNDDTMDLVVKQLSKDDVKRIFTLNSQNKIESIITQSSLIEFLWSIRRNFQSFLDDHLSKYFKHSSEVVSINEEENVINAFKIMKDSHVSAVCILDSERKVVDTLSVKDLRTVIPGLTIMQRLYVSIKEFLNKIEIETRTKRALVTCSKHDRISSILEKFHEQKVHRIWIVKHFKPVGVVTLQDLLKIISIH